MTTVSACGYSATCCWTHCDRGIGVTHRADEPGTVHVGIDDRGVDVVVGQHVGEHDVVLAHERVTHHQQGAVRRRRGRRADRGLRVPELAARGDERNHHRHRRQNRPCSHDPTRGDVSSAGRGESTGRLAQPGGPDQRLVVERYLRIESVANTSVMPDRPGERDPRVGARVAPVVERAARVGDDRDRVVLGDRLQPARHVLGCDERRRDERRDEHPQERDRVHRLGRTRDEAGVRLDPAERVREQEQQQRRRRRAPTSEPSKRKPMMNATTSITVNESALRTTSLMVRPSSIADGVHRAASAAGR